MSISQPKKVLFLITKSNWGGAQRYVYDLATTLDPRQWEPVVAMGGDGELATMLAHAGVRTVTLKNLERDVSLKKEWHFFWSLVRLLREERPTVLHVNSSKAGALGVLAGRLARVPRIIFTAHGWAFNEDRPYWQKLIIKTIHWITILLSHRTIAVSNGLLNEMRWPLAWRKMKVINPGRTIGAMYSRAEARSALTNFHPSLATYPHDPWIVCIAELHPIKRHLVLFAAIESLIARHPTLRLICIGDGQLHAELSAYIAAHKLEQHIFLIGPLTEAARFLKAFDLSILASKSESYGYVLHEAGLAGVPVVATAVGGIPDIVTDGVSGRLVPADDTVALKGAISQLLENETERQTYANTLEAALSERTVTKMTTATTALYQH